jgi:lipopolysaccharide export system permease protein
MSVRGRLLLPILARHCLREFWRTFALTLAAFVAIYVVADFFDRLDDFLKHDAQAGAIVRYFLFKLPLVMSQVAPIAVLAGGLVGLGLLARQNEFVAMRACGVSIWQIATPLLAAAALVGVGIFLWNEKVVPPSARRWHEIESLEIKRRGGLTMFTGREVWYHGRAGFYNINRIALGRRTLYGLTIYQVGTNFRPQRLIEAAAATWDGERWQFTNARSREIGAAGVHEVPGVPDGIVLPETLADFRVAYVEPEEFSYAMLRRQIASMLRKGVDPSESRVDLHLKIALPFASIIMMLLAVPLATRGTRVTSLAAGIGLGFAIGFAYFVVVAFTRALGQSGALPPVMAAWAANALFTMIGCYYLLESD